MIGIGIPLLILSFILYVLIIREKERFHMASDPVCGSLILLFSGLYIITEVTFGPLIRLENHRFVFETGTFVFGVAIPFVILILAGTFTGIRWRYRKYGRPEKKKSNRLKERFRWITRKKPSNSLKNTES